MTVNVTKYAPGYNLARINLRKNVTHRQSYTNFRESVSYRYSPIPLGMFCRHCT